MQKLCAVLKVEKEVPGRPKLRSLLALSHPPLLYCRVQTPSSPFCTPLLPSRPLSLQLFSFSFPSFPLEVGPLNTAKGHGRAHPAGAAEIEFGAFYP